MRRISDHPLYLAALVLAVVLNWTAIILTIVEKSA